MTSSQGIKRSVIIIKGGGRRKLDGWHLGCQFEQKGIRDLEVGKKRSALRVPRDLLADGAGERGGTAGAWGGA